MGGFQGSVLRMRADKVDPMLLSFCLSTRGRIILFRVGSRLKRSIES